MNSHVLPAPSIFTQGERDFKYSSEIIAYFTLQNDNSPWEDHISSSVPFLPGLLILGNKIILKLKKRTWLKKYWANEKILAVLLVVTLLYQLSFQVIWEMAIITGSLAHNRLIYNREYAICIYLNLRCEVQIYGILRTCCHEK